MLDSRISGSNPAEEAYNAALYEGMIEDIMAYRTRIDELEHKANHDGLTGFLNKDAWRTQLQGRIDSANDGDFGVIFIDFTRFKLANDTIGHETVDNLLTNFAKQLDATLHTPGNTDQEKNPESQDFFGYGRLSQRKEVDDQKHVTGRQGGDEFVILCDLTSPNELTAEEKIKAIEARVYGAFTDFMANQPAEVQNVGIDLAMGGAVWHQGTDASAILKQADQAMYENKRTQYPDGEAPR